MKKILYILVFVFLSCPMLNAAELGFGYNNGAPTVKFWWNKSLSSELSLSWDYTKQDLPYSVYGRSAFSYTIAPLMWAFYSNEFGSLSLSVKFRNNIYYNEQYGTKSLTANNYAVILGLPEFEINVPYVDNLRVIGKIGVNFDWYYSAVDGKLARFNASFYGISLAGLGLIYYFDIAGDNKEQDAVIDVNETEAKGVTTTAK